MVNSGHMDIDEEIDINAHCLRQKSFAEAINYGASLAKGEYIVFANKDVTSPFIPAEPISFNNSAISIVKGGLPKLNSCLRLKTQKTSNSENFTSSFEVALQLKETATTFS